jgi:hypothetical protein
MKPSEFKDEVLREYDYDGDKVDEMMNKRFLDINELTPNIFSIINKFAEVADVDGRETLYKFTDQDLRYLKEDILKILEGKELTND